MVCHLDIYQGKNGADVDIHISVKGIPTTQKVLANSLIAAMVSNDPMGYMTVYYDNRYFIIELSIFIQEKMKMLTTGTIRRNWKGNG